MKTESLAVAIEQALARPPCRAGMRLRSEEDLATALNTGRRRVRDSLLHLEQKGVLVRRRGSGTYLRRVPEAIDPLLEQPHSISLEQLLAPDGSRPDVAGRLQASAVQKQLHLALWSDLQFSTPVNRLILGGMVRRADQTGHRLTLHSLLDHALRPLSARDIQSLIARHRSDGCLMISRWAKQFIEASDGRSPRTIFFATGTEAVRFEPTIMLDTAGAVHRAIELLANEGFTRVALIGLGQVEGHDGTIEAQAYANAMGLRGLDYREIIGEGGGLGRTMEAVRDLFKSPRRPDAVYVADDNLLEGVEQALSMLDLIAGRDVGVITLGNAGFHLPPGTDWSRLEFNPAGFGERLIDELLRWIQVGGSLPTSLSVGASWKPETTHRRSSARRIS
jgi:DNA-binding LacI/PurR family transcriptional regulator